MITTELDGWVIEHHSHLESTNITARAKAPWTVVVAGQQTAGRGRFHRAWESPVGGLWMSAVLPASENTSLATFPLAAGWVLVEMLREMGVSEARLRWPNDILVGGEKLAGLLLELQPGEKLILGLGMNVANSLAFEQTPATPAVRLRDLLPATSHLAEPADLLPLILDRLRGLHARFFLEGFAPFCNRINSQIIAPQPVVIELLDGREMSGLYSGIDESGNPVLRLAEGGCLVVRAGDILRFKESGVG
ncbi:MAG: biotin--[acetyl-CoA-carboxylase] ligase [Verrucomicrobiia bacterium]